MSSTDDPACWWFADDDPETLLARLDDHGSDSGAAPAPGTVTRVEAGSGRARVGIVAPDERKIRLARRLVAKGEPWRGRSDIWFTPDGLAQPLPAVRGIHPPDPLDTAETVGKIAFLFPGVEPTFGADGTNLPALADRLGLAAPAIADDTIAHRGASIYRLGIFGDRVLRRLGVEPDVLAGHSLGEWSGTVAAGILPAARADDLLTTVDLDAVDLPDLDFAALAAGVDAIGPVVDELEEVTVSHDNCPHQSVICGPPGQIDQALEQLRAEGVLGYKLDFQSGFHTPAVAALVEPVRDAVAALPLADGHVPLWSATTVGPYPATKEEIVELHFRHLVEPVRFRQLIERLYHDVGVRVFVQAGVGSLTSFVDDTLGSAGLDHLSVQLLTPKRPALAQARRALTALWVEGVEVDPSALAPPPAVTTHGTSVVAETADLLATAVHASGEVIEALAARLAQVATGTPPRPWPGGTTRLVRHLSLETMPETLDHSLVVQPQGWPDASDGFPLVAMTTQIQLLQDIAADHTRGRDRSGTIQADVVEVSGVRNRRWLDLSDPQDVEITLTPADDDVLAVTLGECCRANLRFGQFSPAPRSEMPPLTNPRTPEHTAEEMFEQRIMFHGPRFQGIRTLGPIGHEGMASEFDQLDTPGSLLDNLGKLIAYWVMDLRDWGEAALPISVDRIQRFGPEPPAGTPVHCEVRIVDLQRDAVTADGILVLPDGRLVYRVEGWTSIVFHRDELVEPFYYQPATRYLTEPQPGGWSVVQERWPTGPGRELTSRRFMSRVERDTFAKLNLLQQRRWLIDLVAAKDSVRRWLWDTYQTPSFPVEIALEAEDERHYRAVSPLIPEGHDLRITVSAANWLAVAILGDDEWFDIETQLIPEGVDAEDVAEAAATTLSARNPGADVHRIGPVTNLTPSRLTEVGVAPQTPFAVAWTSRDPR